MISPGELNLRVKSAVAVLAASHHAAALTGAGLSVESGVPAFRGAGGFWERHDPARCAHLDAFMADPGPAWAMTGELQRLIRSVEPGTGHRALAELERRGIIGSVITQNVDGLHQRAGSRAVIELHGSLEHCRCLACGRRAEMPAPGAGDGPPRCVDCGAVLKPGMVFFGEAVPAGALWEAQLVASSCDVLLVVGTACTVAPASELPITARRNGATVIEVNPAATGLTGVVSSIHLAGEAGPMLTALLDGIARR